MLYCFGSFATVLDIFLVDGSAITAIGLDSHFEGSWAWSLNWLSRTTWFQTTLMAIGSCAAVLLVIGWQTRWTTIICWFLVTSLLNSAPPIVGGGDILLNLLLFWGMFLPLGQYWSIDSTKALDPQEPSFTSTATVCVMLQMAMMYLFTGLSKCNEVWYSGEALGIGLSNDRLARPLGHVLAGFPWLTSSLTWVTLAAELALPFVFFSPWKRKLCRSAALLFFIAFHIGIESTMVVMLFSYTSLVGLTVFIPNFWWDHFPLRQLQKALDRFLPRKKTEKTNDRRRKTKLRKDRSTSDGQSFFKRTVRGFLVVCIFYTFFYNVFVEFGTPQIRKQMGSYQRFGEFVALKQYWNMFSDPSPLCHDVACVAKLRDGTQIDLLRNNAEVELFSKRPEEATDYANTRLMIFTTTLTYPENQIHRSSFVDYLCRKHARDPHKNEKDILQCRLIYYLFGAHPSAGKTSYAQMVKRIYPGGL